MPCCLFACHSLVIPFMRYASASPAPLLHYTPRQTLIPRYARPVYCRRSIRAHADARHSRAQHRICQFFNQTQARHVLADGGLRSRLRHRFTRHSFDVSLTARATFQRTHKRRGRCYRSPRQRRQRRQQRAKSPLPPPHGIPQPHVCLQVAACALPFGIQ